MKICDMLPNGIPCHHLMGNKVIIIRKCQEYFQLDSN
jgi:hypothetical protein